MSLRNTSVLLFSVFAASGCSVGTLHDDGSSPEGAGDTPSTPPPGAEVRDEKPTIQPWLFLNKSEDLFRGLPKADFGTAEFKSGPGDSAEEASVQSFDTAIRNQGSRPWCTAFATIGAMENLIQRSFGVTENLSEIDHWNSYLQYSVYASVKEAARTAIVPETSWPYYGSPISGYRSTAIAKVSSWRSLTTRSAVFDAIRAGHPVVVGTSVTSSWNYAGDDGRVSSGGYVTGGHALVVVGFKNDAAWPGGGYMTFRNSWGNRWGNLGYAKVPYDYCTKLGCYFLEIEGVEYKGAPPPPTPPGPSPTPPPTPTPTPTDEPNAASFTTQAQHDTSSPDRFRLHIAGSAAALEKVASVIYDTDESFGGYEFYTVKESADDGFATPFYYRTWAHHWVTNGTAVRLKSGTVLHVKGAAIDW